MSGVNLFFNEILGEETNESILFWENYGRNLYGDELQHTKQTTLQHYEKVGIFLYKV